MATPRQKDFRAVEAVATRSAICILWTKSQPISIGELRASLREAFLTETKPELRAVASISTMELVEALLRANDKLVPLGLEIHINVGRVQMLARGPDSLLFAKYMVKNTPSQPGPNLTEFQMEILGCVYSKKVVRLSELQFYFDTNPADSVSKLVDMKLLKFTTGERGAHFFSVTDEFHRRFPPMPPLLDESVAVE